MIYIHDGIIQLLQEKAGKFLAIFFVDIGYLRLFNV